MCCPGTAAVVLKVMEAVPPEPTVNAYNAVVMAIGLVVPDVSMPDATVRVPSKSMTIISNGTSVEP